MHYPDHRHTLALTSIRRQRTLPDRAIGVVEANEGLHVNLRDIVARGTVPARYFFVEAADFFRLRHHDALEDLLFVKVGDEVEEGAVLAGRSREKGKRLLAPVTGLVVFIGQGRIIVQETPDLIELEAGLVGQVVEKVPSRGVVIQATGALIQGVWGNGRRLIGALQFEPEEGLEGIFDDPIDRPYAGTIVFTRRSLKETGLMIAETQNIGGIVAPSMDADLYERALEVPVAVLLTEGFGEIEMSGYVFSILEGLQGRQASLDAYRPGRWETRRPELFINIASREHTPEPTMQRPLRQGVTVRLTRAPHAGTVGRVTDLPKSPQLLDNGLRVLCAKVELVTGEVALVPLANLEVFGK